MKYIFSILFIACAASCFSQVTPLKAYKDPVNGFSISIPAAWRQLPANATVKLIVYRTEAGDTAKALENFNLNIIPAGKSTLEKEYDNLVAALAAAHNHTISEKGDISINGLAYKWFVETHKGPALKRIWNYDFITYKNGKTYILTFIAQTGLGFETYRPLFLQIANSLAL